ncbi:MAG: protein kinase [archaeon]|nr:protein kinase [archaeon]
MGETNTKPEVPVGSEGTDPSKTNTPVIKDDGKPIVPKEKSLIEQTNDLIITEKTTLPFEDYSRLNKIQEGSISTIFRVESNITGQIRAMKVVSKKSKYVNPTTELMEIKNEVKILSALDHPNILKVFEFYSGEDSFYLVEELCADGDLFGLLDTQGQFEEPRAAFIMFQLLSALNYCHERNVIHKDIKPENILISHKEYSNFPCIKLCDFSISSMPSLNYTSDPEKKFFKVTYYTPPEVVDKNTREEYNDKCDIWSAGIIMYMLLSGYPPFTGDDSRQIGENIKAGRINLDAPPFDKISKAGKDLLTALLNKNPSKRISAMEALNHPWFANYSSKMLVNSILEDNIIQDFVINMKNYKPSSVIQETALAYLIHNFPQRKDIIVANKFFNIVDENNDGKIKKEEFLKALEGRIKTKKFDEDINIIYNNLDSDNDGEISFEEFIRASVDKKSFLDDEYILFAFKYFDKDGNNVADAKEIREIFEEKIKDKTSIDEVLQKIISQVDTNKDGLISYEEFKKAMSDLLK